ncbi:MAG TPA: isoprenylcysteine carboxylmethyltransferase family protein [Steroidobacteraceae bacterium]
MAKPDKLSPETVIPESATNFALNLLALAAGLAALFGVLQTAGAEPQYRFIPYAPALPCLAVALVIAAGSWRRFMRHQWRDSGLKHDARRAVDARRVAMRLAGFAATLALIAFAYWLLPEYAGSFYQPFWNYLRTLSPVLLLVPLYFTWIDTRLAEDDDEYLAFGRLALGQWRKINSVLIRRHLMGWTVKGFFLPLMTVYLVNEITMTFHAYGAGGIQAISSFEFLNHLAFAIDVLFCVVGYTCTLRLFDSHIRSVEPTMLGWVAALVCYQPFYSVIGQFYLQYEGDVFWDTWLNAWPALRSAWGGVIIGLLMIYTLSTVAFGVRFSNLTHRGIITGGPYRFTKHPAYLSKNLSWWLISVPFVSGQGAATALRHCCLLLLLNGVYYVRARTEERHLSWDPKYVAYAEWIEQHGLLRGLGKLFPFLRYRRPRAAAGGKAPP